MKYTLDRDYEKCTGCQSCSVACSLQRERISNPKLGRIQLAHRREEGIHIPVVCNQCEEAPCMNVCPVGALSRDTTTEVVLLDYDICIGCRMCTLACPFGAMLVNLDTGKVMKCDLCADVETGPICYKVCHTEAIRYVPLTQAMSHRRQKAAQETMLDLASAIPLTLG
jgi:Fe-S-cluster-containing hydrogenase component 2